MSGCRQCPLCGRSGGVTMVAEDLHVDAVGRSFRVVRCDCRAIFTDPLPTQTELAELYREGTYVAGVSGLRRLMRRVIVRERLRSLRNVPPGRILDVGCGTGDFLDAMRAKGWTVVGVERAQADAAIARGRGISVLNAVDWARELEPKSFDAVTFWHALEHLPDPFGALSSVHRLLKDDGIIVVEVPNAASLTFRLAGRHWYHLDVPRHLQHFTPDVLTSLLASCGFGLVRRRNFHVWDSAACAYTILSAWGGARLEGSAPRLGVAGPLSLALSAVMAIPWWLVTSFAGRSESVTLTARRTSPSGADRMVDG